MYTYVNSNTTPEYRGLLVDMNEITNAPNGSVFVSMDTSEVYMYDAENKQWKPL